MSCKKDDYFPDNPKSKFNSIDGIIFINFLTIQIIEEIFTPKPQNIHLPNQTFSMFSVIGMYMDMNMNDMIPDPSFWTYLFNPQPASTSTVLSTVQFLFNNQWKHMWRDYEHKGLIQECEKYEEFVHKSPLSTIQCVARELAVRAPAVREPGVPSVRRNINDF